MKFCTDKSYYAYKGADKSLSGYVIIRTISGLGNIHINGFPKMKLEPATLLIVKYDSIIDYHPFDNEWDFWWFAFDLNGLLVLPLNVCQYLPYLPEENSLMKNSLTHLQNTSFLSQLTASSYMGLLVGYWTQYTKAVQPFYHKSSMDNLLRYIHSHISDAISVEEMAKMCGLSSRQFYNVFLHTTETSPKKYILKLRMEKGAHLLLNTNQSVAVIACTLGYWDALYFSRVFKRYFSVSPKTYRKRHYELTKLDS